jgi:hypothetical protein
MRHVIGLYDAPAPAAAALSDLLEAGFSAGDVAVAPEQAASLLGPGAPYAHLPRGEADLTAELASFGVPRGDAVGYAQAVARGAILVVVSAPALSVPLAAGALQVPGATDLDLHRRRVEADQDLHYVWHATEDTL